MPEKDRNKIIEKIRQLNRLAADQKGKPEGDTAAKMARAMMKKYSITAKDLNEPKKKQEPRPDWRRAAEQNRPWGWEQPRRHTHYHPGGHYEGTYQQQHHQQYEGAYGAHQQHDPWTDYDNDFDWLRDIFEEFLEGEGLGDYSQAPIDRLKRDAYYFAEKKAHEVLDNVFSSIFGSDEEE